MAGVDLLPHSAWLDGLQTIGSPHLQAKKVAFPRACIREPASERSGRRRITEQLSEWLQIIAGCDQIGELGGIVLQLSDRLSLSAVAGGMLTGSKSASGDLFYFNNWPASWVHACQDNAVRGQDPVVRWALGSGAPITWLDLKARLDVSDPGLGLLALVAAHGYVEGYILPVRTTAGHFGLLSVAGDRLPLSTEEQGLLQVWARRQSSGPRPSPRRNRAT